jgi:hypothetical protein
MHTLFTDQSSFTRHYGQTTYPPPNTSATTHPYPYDQYTRYYAGSAYGLSTPQSRELTKPPYSYIALIGMSRSQDVTTILTASC